MLSIKIWWQTTCTYKQEAPSSTFHGPIFCSTVTASENQHTSLTAAYGRVYQRPASTQRGVGCRPLCTDETAVVLRESAIDDSRRLVASCRREDTGGRTNVEDRENWWTQYLFLPRLHDCSYAPHGMQPSVPREPAHKRPDFVGGTRGLSVYGSIISDTQPTEREYTQRCLFVNNCYTLNSNNGWTKIYLFRECLLAAKWG